MGVHGLWDLVAPVGRRVSVETLSGKKLAIDASIWMVQFMKAMRDEKGEMVRNAHLLGFFRRICKLLYLRTKPVFVFDGATPALKRRTVIARRRQRENAQAKIRKTAEKLLLNHLKSMRLKELAKDLENQRKNQKIDDDSKGKKILLEGSKLGSNNDNVESYDQEMLDEMLAASIAAEEQRRSNNTASMSVVPEQEVDDDENEEITVDFGKQKEDRKSNAKVKEVLIDLRDMERDNLGRDDVIAESYDQEKLDEMLAASIAAEEDVSLNKSASTSAAAILSEEEGNDEVEEMILPEMCGKVDPAVLAALPPSMQLDLLVQMRERLMAENRQKYQKVKKAPEKFSEIQIEAYLKTVAFRREIDHVQKAAAGNGVGGVQSSRIASEANREFIFSSCFTGDKQLLTSTGVQRNGNKQQQTPATNPSLNPVDCVASTSKSNAVSGLVQDEPRRLCDEDVETYLDESGRMRVSRVRAMGMRMTRDLQRNLDLMKEIEQDRTHAVKTANAQSELTRDKIGSPKSFPYKTLPVKCSHDKNIDSVTLNERNQESILNNEDSIPISFEVGGGSKCIDSDDDVFTSLVAGQSCKSILNNEDSIPISFEFSGGSKCFDSDDDVFTSLVAGQPVQIPSADNVTSRRQTLDSASDSDWEEGIIEERGNSSSNGLALETNPPLKESNISDDSEVEWEDGGVDHENSSVPSESRKPASSGYLEEEADFQEAIRRSLEDLGVEKFNITPSDHEKLKISKENAHKDVGFLDQVDSSGGLILPEKDVAQQDQSFSEILATGEMDRVAEHDISQAFSYLQSQLKFSEADNMGTLTNKSYERDLGSNDGQSSQDTNIRFSVCTDMPSAESAAPLEAREIHVILEHFSDTTAEALRLSTSMETLSGVSHIPKTAFNDMSFAGSVGDEGNRVEAEPSVMVNEEKKPKTYCRSVEVTNPSTSVVEQSTDSTIQHDVELNLDGEKISNDQLHEKKQDIDNFMSNENPQVDFSEATLQEEILILGQETMNLGIEQKKLERNAESVSSEMFAECQELLQMFGLPYIIAPMEAEAQCAYMELANLVDGVVTDDSDVFLFGARNVYKNIFDDRKYVETYFMKDIEKELGLTREKLIRMALLLGSDYTEGISGIGIVNAIEVVNAFPEEDGLEKFRQWIESPDPTILGNFDVHPGMAMRKKGDLYYANNNVGVDSFGQNIPEDHKEEHSADHIQEIRQLFMDKHRNVSKNWHVPSSFPSEAVISAYISPQVDKSTEPFTWGKPDLHVLRRLCWEKFAWGIQKSDELLLPVLKEYNKHETQLRLDAFYTFNERFAKIRSKRIKKALKGITGYQSSELMDDDVKEFSKSRNKRTIRPGESGNSKADAPAPLKRAKGGVSRNRIEALEKSTIKLSMKRTAGEPVLTEVDSPGQQWQAEGRKNTHKGRRDGRGKGRGRRRGRGRGRGKESRTELSDSSYDYVSDDDDELEVHVEESEEPREIRRSMRSRKPANYTVDDFKVDVDSAQDQGDKQSNESAVEPDLFGVKGSTGVSTSPNGKEHQKMEDPLPDDFSTDYLEAGEEFFTDDDGSGKAGASQTRCPGGASVSEDYLKMGGGFCMDESGMCADQDAAHSPPITTFEETADASKIYGKMEEADKCKDVVPLVSSVKRTLHDMQDAEQGTDCVNAMDSGGHSEISLCMPKSTGSKSMAPRLGAMPFLKRKRRKN